MAFHLRIEGIVQGVGYRQWLQRQAAALDVAGWVRNRADESVEAVIDGAPAAVESLVRAAMNGPAGAKVDAIARREAAEAERAAGPAEGMAILPTE